jgi:hypothetical protein
MNKRQAKKKRKKLEKLIRLKHLYPQTPEELKIWMEQSRKIQLAIAKSRPYKLVYGWRPDVIICDEWVGVIGKWKE